MTVTIIGSINSSKEEIKKAVDCFNSISDIQTIFDPVWRNAKAETNGESLLDIFIDYLDYIKTADLIVVVPKSPGVYGESTTYELAYAMKLGKPIVEFVKG